jgi:Holliday junction resolvase
MSATSMTQRASFATSSVSAARAMPKSASSRGALVVRGAASKAKKQGQLDALAAMANAEETFLVAGFNYQSLSVRVEYIEMMRLFSFACGVRARARVIA